MLRAPLFERVSSVLRESLMHFYPVELDAAAFDVLWASGRDFSLVRQLKEGYVVDVEDEGAALHGIVERKFPRQRVALEFEREHSCLRKLFPAQNFFPLPKLQL